MKPFRIGMTKKCHKHNKNKQNDKKNNNNKTKPPPQQKQQPRNKKQQTELPSNNFSQHGHGHCPSNSGQHQRPQCGQKCLAPSIDKCRSRCTCGQRRNHHPWLPTIVWLTFLPAGVEKFQFFLENLKLPLDCGFFWRGKSQGKFFCSTAKVDIKRQHHGNGHMIDD